MSPVQRRQRSCSSVSGTAERKRPRSEPHRYAPGEGSIARTSEYQASDALRRATAVREQSTLYAKDYLPREWKIVDGTGKYVDTRLYVKPDVHGRALRSELQEGEDFFVTAQEAVERSINDDLTKYTLERNVPMVFDAAARLRNYLTDQHAVFQPEHVPEEVRKPKVPAPGTSSTRKDPPSASRTAPGPRTDVERGCEEDLGRVPASTGSLSRLSKCSRTKSTHRKAQVSQAAPGSAAGAANRAAAAPPRRAQLEEDLDSATSESEEWEDSGEDEEDEEDDDDDED
jgi:hypothetical protein